MTRMTKKKEVSDKVDKATKAKPSGIRSKKASTKADAPAPKTKKLESSKSLKELKNTKKAAPKKAKALKQEVVKPQVKKKTIAAPKKIAQSLPQETLFPEICFVVSEKETKLQNEMILAKEETAIPFDFKSNAEIKPQILKSDNLPVPKYMIPEDKEISKKRIHFENIIANDSIIEAIKKAGFSEPNETLQKALPAALRGSDVLLIKPKEIDGFLVGTLATASKILSESLPKGTAHAPSVLFISPSQKKADEVFQASQAIFNSLGISILKLDDHEKSENSENKFSHPIDVLVTTPKNLNIAIQNKSIISKNIGLCFAMETQSFSSDESIADLELALGELSQERTQKIISTNENTPYVREFSFKFLEDPEYITTLPSQIKERQPKQFAHALQATQKFQVLLGHLKTHKPICAAIFANTKPVAEWIAFKLFGNGIKVELITSQLSPQKRLTLAKSIKACEANVIVTTDSISHSLGIKELNCIYNFDLPDSASTFINRISRIEGTKNPIAVSFICEDYGFNIKAIEEELGFKIHIAAPDRNYFNLKDTSEYPLESSGKVKRIGVTYEEESVEVTDTLQPKVEIKTQEQQQKVTKKYEIETSVPKTASSEVASSTSYSPKLYPRPESEPKEEISASPRDPTKSHSTQFSQKPSDSRKTTSYQQNANKPQFDSVNRQNNDKFNRRDERAKEAIDAARFAAKAASEKRRERPSQKTSAPPKRPGLFDIMVSLVQDAVQSAAAAAKESVAMNIQENLPALSSVLDRFKILKKPSKLQKDHKKH
jgi:superfamily II DNA/RNA helicase